MLFIRMRIKFFRFLLCRQNDEGKKDGRHQSQKAPYSDDCEPQPCIPIPEQQIAGNESAEKIQRDSDSPPGKPCNLNQLPFTQAKFA